jgi:hypothetical protein
MMTTVDEVLAILETLPLARLLDLAAELGRLITRRSSEQSEVAAARTAASVAVDAYEDQAVHTSAKK